LSDDVDEVCLVDVIDVIDEFLAASISFAKRNIFGRFTNQLQIFNWFISLNCGGSSFIEL